MSKGPAERWRVVAICIALVVVPTAALVACAGKTSGEHFDCANDDEQPHQLACTGLYSDWSAKTVAASAVPFLPAYPAWSDGMEKTRWITIPPGASIDQSDPNEWIFPVGTRLWKEFRRAGRRIETRFSLKRPDGTWFRTTYRWSADGETAAFELAQGERDVEGTGYEIPAKADCASCHNGRKDGVLGYDAVTLSAPGTAFQGDARAAAALGWLHANCGTSCHSESPRAMACHTGLNLRLDSASLNGPIESTNAYKTAVGVLANYTPPSSGARMRIEPGNAEGSVLFLRASYRGPEDGVQMPPIASHAVDAEAMKTLRAWIESLQ